MAKSEGKEEKIEVSKSVNGHHPAAARTFYDKDADLKILRGKKIVILGYGSQGHGQALNLKDSGMNVTVSVRKGGKGYNLAQKHGWNEGKNLHTNNAEAVKDADWVHFLLPDETQREVWEQDVKP